MQANYRAANNWATPVVLSAEANQELLWWLEQLIPWAWKGRPVFPDLNPVHLRLTTDASPTGWGAHLDRLDGSPVVPASGTFQSALAAAPHCVRELYAVSIALAYFLPQLHGRRVLVRSDNMQVVHHIERLGGHSLQLHRLMRDIWGMCLQNAICLSAEYLPGVDMVAEGVDRLSRTVPAREPHALDRSDWKLNPIIFDNLDRRFGPFAVDRFATACNAQQRGGIPLPFNSRFWEAGTAGVDAFRQNWRTDDRGRRIINYGNPPFCLVARTIRHVLACKAHAVIIVPKWPAQPWWPLLSQAFCICVLPWRTDTFLPASRSHSLPVGFASFRALAVVWRFDE